MNDERNEVTTSRLLTERSLLLELSQTISTTLDLGTLVQFIADGTARLLGVETTALYLVEPDGLLLAATTPPLDPGMPESLRRLKREEHPYIDKTLTSQRPWVLADAAKAELSASERAVVEQRNLRSLLFLPFGHDGEPVGVLILGTKNQERRFDDDLELCLALANQLALAVHNARLHTSLKGYATALERQIAEQARLEERLRHAQKMEALGHLAGGLAHDFNNFLQIISGYSNLAQSQVPAASEAYQSLAHVSQAVERASGLVRSLLTFARRQVLSLRVMDLNNTISGLLPMLRPLLTKKVEVSVQFDIKPANVRADPSQLEQILINLCVNARDAMPEGGSLTITTERAMPSDPRFSSINLPGPGPYVRLAVTDTGKGMDAETCRRAFEPFFTTKGIGAGTGLGLSMVHGLVAQHGGVSHIVTALNQGTTMEVFLPLATEDGATSTEG
jgi:signal transduction histidine kinase